MNNLKETKFFNFLIHQLDVHKYTQWCSQLNEQTKQNKKTTKPIVNARAVFLINKHMIKLS